MRILTHFFDKILVEKILMQYFAFFTLLWCDACQIELNFIYVSFWYQNEIKKPQLRFGLRKVRFEILTVDGLILIVSTKVAISWDLASFRLFQTLKLGHFVPKCASLNLHKSYRGQCVKIQNWHILKLATFHILRVAQKF